jgi:hypothetical protein
VFVNVKVQCVITRNLTEVLNDSDSYMITHVLLLTSLMPRRPSSWPLHAMQTCWYQVVDFQKWDINSLLTFWSANMIQLECILLCTSWVITVNAANQNLHPILYTCSDYSPALHNSTIWHQLDLSGIFWLHTHTQLWKWHCCAPVIKNQYPTSTIPH